MTTNSSEKSAAWIVSLVSAVPQLARASSIKNRAAFRIATFIYSYNNFGVVFLFAPGEGMVWTCSALVSILTVTCHKLFRFPVAQAILPARPCKHRRSFAEATEGNTPPTSWN
jgi:hypothetical protein